MFSIDELMYINDGIDPYKQYGYWDIFLRENPQYNKGGIIVKPKRQNAIVGGMPFRDINDIRKNNYEMYKNDKLNIFDVDEFNEENDNINKTLKHMDELIELYIDAKLEGDSKYKNINITEFNKLNDDLDKNKMTEEEKKLYDDITNKFLDIKGKTIDELRSMRKNENDNMFYNQMTDLGKNKAEEVKNEYLTNPKKRNEIRNKWLGEWQETDQRKTFDNLDNDNDKADYLEKFIKNVEKGNVSENKLIDKDILLTFIDKDESKAYNTKDMNGLNNDFIQTLKNIGMSDDDIKNKVLEKLNFDVVKDNTIWELKAFGKNSYDVEKYDRYSKAKFYGSELTTIVFNDKNGKKKYYELQYDFKIKNNKVVDISYVLQPKYNQTNIYVGSIIKSNPNGYNYYIMENNKDTIQYINPLKDDNWKNIDNQIKQGKKGINIPNSKFLKFPKSYIENFNKIRLKKSNRLNDKKIYENWERIKKK